MLLLLIIPTGLRPKTEGMFIGHGGWLNSTEKSFLTLELTWKRYNQKRGNSSIPFAQ